MFKHAFLLAGVPIVLSAQNARPQTVATAKFNAGASAQITVDGEMAAARHRGLPDEVIRRRVAEARTRGVSEALLSLEARRLRLMMQAGVESMERGGRTKASDEEIERCVGAMEQGYTRAQVTIVAQSAPPERSLSVAFDVLTRLAQRGYPIDRAMGDVTAKLRTHEPDREISSLLVLKTGGEVRPPRQ